MDYLQALRNEFFRKMGKYRITRILTCSFVIAVIWSFADVLSGSYEPMVIHNLLCLVIGVISERFIPWGKPSPKMNN